MILRIIKAIGVGTFWIIWVMLFIFSLVVIGVNIFTQASHDKNWTDDQKVLPYAEIEGDMITIFNIRNNSYTSTSTYDVDYYHRTYDVSKLRRVWFLVEPFNSLPGAAHTLLSFEFENDEFVSISVEIRKEKGESFHPIKGLFNQYELMYVIADERDVIKLRSNYRKDDVYLYPMKATPEQARALFVDMLNRVNMIKDRPEFYNTIGSNCTTNIAFHVNKLLPGKVPFDIRLIMPADSDLLAYELGLIDTDLSIEQAREKYHINERAEKYADDPEFSQKIRQ